LVLSSILTLVTSIAPTMSAITSDTMSVFPAGNDDDQTNYVVLDTATGQCVLVRAYQNHANHDKTSSVLHQFSDYGIFRPYVGSFGNGCVNLIESVQTYDQVVEDRTRTPDPSWIPDYLEYAQMRMDGYFYMKEMYSDLFCSIVPSQQPT
jgi:hypothetical protein